MLNDIELITIQGDHRVSKVYRAMTTSRVGAALPSTLNETLVLPYKIYAKKAHISPTGLNAHRTHSR